MRKLFNLALAINIVVMFVLSGVCKAQKIDHSKIDMNLNKDSQDSIWVEYKEVTGIGYEVGVTRRDPSDIIKVGDHYYIWYTRIPAMTNGSKTPLYNSGYYGTIWYATSSDGGHSWIEKGEVLGIGEKGHFDSHAVFTPNILNVKDKYYLFYTGVKPTLNNSDGSFENNSQNDYTAIGVAIADNPDGPFIRGKNNPILSKSNNPDSFDSYRLDDAAMMVRDEKYWLYYKGRSIVHGVKGPAQTRMGVATANKPKGPYKKYGIPILDHSHEVLIWNYKGGVFALASLSSTLEFALDGLNFESKKFGKKLKYRPSAPGLYRPHLTDHSKKEVPGWGISMQRKGKDIYLVRFEFKTRDDS